ncbi:MAG: hypothetical protein M1822_008251 [Bathelium mastoideum]|nr:MAG: hypothetical protein M1822_008251 [Bathelium mastoideum]
MSNPSVNLNESHVAGIVAADLTARVIAIITVGLRFYARRLNRVKYWWDDWFMLLAAVLSIASTVEELLQVRWGSGRHVEWVQAFHPDRLASHEKNILASELMYPITLASIKMSLLFFFIRLFGINKRFALVCWIQIGMVLAWFIIVEFVFLFQCNPIWMAWSIDRIAGKCFAYEKLFIGTNTVSVIMDLMILITPLPCVWSLQMPLKQKLAVSAVLAIGLSEVALSAIRLAKLSVLSFEDPTWDAGIALLWSTLEISAALACTNLPSLGPLLPNSWLGRGKTVEGPDSSSSTTTRNKTRSGRNQDFPPQDDEHELIPVDSSFKVRKTTVFSVEEERALSVRSNI